MGIRKGFPRVGGTCYWRESRHGTGTEEAGSEGHLSKGSREEREEGASACSSDLGWAPHVNWGRQTSAQSHTYSRTNTAQKG